MSPWMLKGPLTAIRDGAVSMWIQDESVKALSFILEGTIDYEFRMTVVPFLHREDDVYETASYVQRCKEILYSGIQA